MFNFVKTGQHFSFETPFSAAFDRAYAIC